MERSVRPGGLICTLENQVVGSFCMPFLFAGTTYVCRYDGQLINTATGTKKRIVMEFHNRFHRSLY